MLDMSVCSSSASPADAFSFFCRKKKIMQHSHQHEGICATRKNGAAPLDPSLGPGRHAQSPMPVEVCDWSAEQTDMKKKAPLPWASRWPLPLHLHPLP